jgi:pimeloyl-ACP methyl ester carboxylesterase
MRTPCRCERLPINGLTYHVRHWGPDDAPLLLMLHGWMDSSASFQFTVDALRQSWHVLAPDWRGYGQSEWLNRRYWFADYYADLDYLLDRYSPDAPARIVGHSMGGAVASIYGGVRPERIAGLLMVDFLGLPPTKRTKRPAASATGSTTRARRRNCAPMPAASNWRRACCSSTAACCPNGRVSRDALHQPPARWPVVVACDPWHKVPSPHLYHRGSDGLLARDDCPGMLVTADEGYVLQRFGRHARRTAAANGLLCQRQACTSTTAGTTSSTIGRKSSPS